MKVLVTGFDPFGGESINPALEAIKTLPDKVDNIQIIKLEIPTVFNKSLKVIENAIENYEPDFVISVGQAGGRYDISLERVAINIDDARITDNEGNQPIDTPIIEGGQPAYFTTLPVKAMVTEIRNQGIPASLSNTAGTFVCNHVMYGVLEMCDRKFKGVKAGFIHIPYMTSQVIGKGNMPYMSLDEIVKGLIAGIKAINSEEKKEILGEIS